MTTTMQNISQGFAEVWKDGQRIGSVTYGHEVRSRFGDGFWYAWMNGDGKPYGSRAEAVRALGEATR